MTRRSDNLTPLQELAEAATQGPWPGGFDAYFQPMSMRRGPEGEVQLVIDPNTVATNAYFAALDPQTVLALIARVRAAESKLDRDRMAKLIEVAHHGELRDEDNRMVCSESWDAADAILSDESEARA